MGLDWTANDSYSVCTLFYWKFPAKALFRRYSEHETRRMYSLLLASNGSNVEGGK
ncbi:hypothetical protein BJX63DRAFT_391676 [Aspergillus granulosus]|uniref:Uncharacterized protein n=1 Tax=Aspergillus granulosus TaxID=176169 RepID=A0ABR4HH55_9EURO